MGCGVPIALLYASRVRAARRLRVESVDTRRVELVAISDRFRTLLHFLLVEARERTVSSLCKF